MRDRVADAEPQRAVTGLPHLEVTVGTLLLFHFTGGDRHLAAFILLYLYPAFLCTKGGFQGLKALYSLKKKI